MAAASGPIVPLACPTAAACRDAADVAYACATSQIRTGVSSGLARHCRPTRCAVGPCAEVAVLSGEVVDSDTEVSHRVPGRTVRVRRDNGREEGATTADADGRYYFAVPLGWTVLVHAEQPGFLNEVHAVTVPATGWDVPLDLRHPATLGHLLGDPAGVNPAGGLMVIEFVGAGSLAGAGARTEPAASMSFVFDGAGRPVRGDRLLDHGHRLLVLGGFGGGPVRVDLRDPPGQHCAPQAALAAWPVGPDALIQVDAECRPAPPAP